MNDSITSTTRSASLFPSSLRRATGRVFAALILAAGVAGCGASSEEGASQPVGTEQAAERTEAAHHDGIGGLFTETAKRLDLSPQQKQAVDAIKADLHEKSVPMREAKAKLAATFADGVQKGAIDAQALAASKAELTRAAEALKPALQDGLNRLHATLDAGQRDKLVSLLQERGEGRREAFFEGRGMFGRMKKIAEELDLTKDQQQSIRSSFRAAHEEHEGQWGDKKAKREEMRTRFAEIATAFKSESFDARALDIGKELPAMADHGIERAERMLSVVTPILTPPQRAKLATIVKTHGAAMDKAADD